MLFGPDVEDLRSWDVVDHTEEEEGEDEESAEEPVQNQEDLLDPDHQITKTRFKCDAMLPGDLRVRVNNTELH